MDSAKLIKAVNATQLVNAIFLTITSGSHAARKNSEATCRRPLRAERRSTMQRCQKNFFITFKAGMLLKTRYIQTKYTLFEGFFRRKYGTACWPAPRPTEGKHARN